MVTASRLTLKVMGVITGTVVAAGLLPGFTTAAAAAGRPADNGARIIAEKRINAQTLDVTIQSRAVGASLKVRLLLPKGWRRNANRTWPTIHLLGGGGGIDDHTVYTKRTDIARLASRWNTIVVMPYNGATGGFVNWFNYGARGKPAWEQFHTFELMQLLTRNLRAGPRRAVIGISAGALGAMAYAGHKPKLYQFVGAFSGVLHITMPGAPPTLMALNARANVDPFKIWGVPGIHDANWKANDPYWLASRLRGIKLYVSSGTTGRRGPLDPKKMTLEQAIRSRIVGGLSEQFVGAASKSFVARLRQLNIPVTTHIYGDGWHSWAYWKVELHRAWPLAMKAIGARRV